MASRRARVVIAATVIAAVVVAILLGRCQCDDDLADVAAALQGLRWEMPCTPGQKGPFCDAVVQKPVVTATLAGDPKRQYDVTLRFRGVVEWESYAGGKAEDHWYIGGHPDNGVFNIYQLAVSAPAQVFYLNQVSGDGGLAPVRSIDYQKTIRVQGGATVTLSADAQDGRLCSNTDDKSTPLVIAGVPPAPAPFDGQFIQMDVISVVPAPSGQR